MYTLYDAVYSPFCNTFYKLPVGNMSPTQYANFYPVNTGTTQSCATSYVWPAVPFNSYTVTVPTAPVYSLQPRPDIWFPAYIA